MNEPVIYESYPYPYHETHEDSGIEKFKAVMLCTVLGLGTAVGLYYFGRNFITQAEKEQTQKDAVTEGNPAAYATQFKQAFDNNNWFGWGTDNTLLFNTILMIPTKAMYSKVQDSYQKLYNRSLNADLEDDLSSTEYNRFILILSRKPES